MSDVEVKIDREFTSLIPPPSPDERELLKDSLAEEGLRDPLVVWEEKHILLDGHNRLGLCKELSIEPRFTYRSFPSREAARDFILHNQLSRRNLSPEAASYLRGKRYQEQRHQGVKTESALGQDEPKRLSQELADEYKVGEKTIRRDAKFCEAVDAIVSHCGDETRPLLLSRQVRVSRGQVAKIAGLTPSQQKRTMQFLADNGRLPRKPRGEGAGTTITLPREPEALAEKLFNQLGKKGTARVLKFLESQLHREPATAGR